MQVGQIFLGAILAFAWSCDVFAANKTHITDTLGAGNNRTDVTLSIHEGSAKYSYLSGIAQSSDNSKFSGYSLLFDYSRGITDRLDISIFVPLIENSKSTGDSSSGYTYKSKYEGQGDIAFSAQYLLLDKQKDHVDWTIAGTYSPSTASSESGSPEVSYNGTVISAGKTGKAGRGYAQSGIATAVAVPAGLGDIVFTATYLSGGDYSSGGTTTKYGDTKSFGVYLESMIGERTTFTPSINYSQLGSTTYGTQATPSDSSYLLGLSLTHDVSKTFSLRAETSYQWMNDQAYTDNSGTRISISSFHFYVFRLSTIFFF